MDNEIQAVTRIIRHNETTCFQPGVRVVGTWGQTTHWAKGLAFVDRKDARDTALQLAHESQERGYVTA